MKTRTLMAATAITALTAGAALAQDAMQDDMMMDGMMMSGTTVTFPQIDVAQDGYVVIHETNADGSPVVPASIAHAPIMAGTNSNVVVEDPGGRTAGANYVAMLHVEDNGNSTYDFGEGMTDVDVPVMMNGAPVTSSFTAMEVAAEAPATDAAPTPDNNLLIQLDGASISGQSIRIPQVNATAPGWIVIHATNADGTPVVPDSLGHAFVNAGRNENVDVTISEAFKAGDLYVAMLHEETNGNNSYDFGPGSTDVDTPVLENGQPLIATFQGADQSGEAEDDMQDSDG